MRKLLFFIPLAAIIYYSCSTTPAKFSLNLLKTDSLPTQNFVIDINKDTLLHTINGSWLKIDKGTFSSENGKVALEIKEALSMQQIIKAGLVTQSNGQPLASGGMIYINAAAGQKITINKPFKVAVPSASLDKNMQLFKGEKTGDGNINWKDPKAVDDNLQMSALKKGEIFFRQKCASCHGIGKEGSGPDLANFVNRFHPFEGEGGGHLTRHKFLKQLESGSWGTTTRNAEGKIIKIER
ncbi:MAG: cytochrome c, partial [Bacteroidota bacterium]